MHAWHGCAGVSGQPSRKAALFLTAECTVHHRALHAPIPPTAANILADLLPNTCPAGVAGAVSRSATAPIDRLKMLLQIHDCEKGMTIKEGIRKMSAEGAARPGLVLLLVPGCNCVDAGLVLGWVAQLLRRPRHLPCCPCAVLPAAHLPGPPTTVSRQRARFLQGQWHQRGQDCARNSHQADPE
jgi:hypothetical protein